MSRSRSRYGAQHIFYLDLVHNTLADVVQDRGDVQGMVHGSKDD